MEIEDKTKDSLSDRLVYALEMTGTRKADLARAINVKPQVIQFLCTSKTKSSRFAFEIASALGLNTRWLATGEGEMFMADDPKHKLFQSYQPLPVLKHHQLLAKASKMPFTLEPLQEYTLFKKAENLFCTRMPDHAMHPLLPTGSLLFIKETSNYQPVAHDLLVVCIPEFDAIVIREVIIENSNVTLMPQNTQLFQPISYSSNLQVMGVIIECHWPIRR